MTIDVDAFLKQFGHPDIASAQRLYGLPETGEADPMTLRVLANTPRCGVPDNFGFQATAVNKWGITDLKWFVEAYPLGLVPAAVDFEIKTSLGYWAEVTPFKFERTQDRYAAHLLLTTAKGPPLFDGRGNVVERGEQPTSENQRTQLRLWLDSDELWTTQATTNGQPLLRAFGHGFGHNLGLSHSEIYGMLMYPLLTARVYRPMEEDIERIQAIYGGKPQPAPVAPAFIRSRTEAYNRIYEGNLPLVN